MDGDRSRRRQVRVDVVGDTLVVTIDRPHRRNAVDRDTALELNDAWTRLEEDPDVRVCILTGAGGTFCAGMDLTAVETGLRPVVGARGFGGLVAAPPSKPMIAAVEGWAVGGGLEMALACDLIVAAEDAQFGLPEVARGLVARGGGLVRLTRRLPYSLAMEAILTGEPFDARTAEHHGLVNRVTRRGEALEGALELAAKISANAPLAVRASKRVTQQSWSWPEDGWDERQEEIVAPVFASHDAKEGARAFRDKRQPMWSGQ